jgi:protease-4
VLVLLPLLVSPGCIVIPLSDLFKEPPLREQVLREGTGDFADQKIAVIDLQGMITASESRSLLRPHPNTVAEVKARLDRASRDGDVRAVVLRIGSPGGEVTACDILHREVSRFREATRKPVVACIQEQGASGAYYVAVAADAILSHPTAIVGSIGAVLASYDISGLLDKIGVKVAPIKSASKKDLNSPFRHLSEEEREILQSLVNQVHQRFVDVILAGRPALTREDLEELADGRVLSGIEAARRQLVDRVGYLDDALEDAAARAGIESPAVVSYARRARSGANIYTQVAPALGATAPGGQGGREAAAAAEISVRWSPEWEPGARLLYLWQPGM